MGSAVGNAVQRVPDRDTVDAQDNVVVAGYTFGDLLGANKNDNNTTSDFFICKFDPAGTQILAFRRGPRTSTRPGELPRMATATSTSPGVVAGTSSEP